MRTVERRFGGASCKACEIGIHGPASHGGPSYGGGGLAGATRSPGLPAPKTPQVPASPLHQPGG